MANSLGLRSTKAQKSLRKVVGNAEFVGANRVGCALLYLGQVAEGEEAETYLGRAITDYSDSIYGDGVQVGAYARLSLAHHHAQAGRDEEARSLLQEIRDGYPYAVDHSGNPLSEQMPIEGDVW